VRIQVRARIKRRRGIVGRPVVAGGPGIDNGQLWGDHAPLAHGVQPGQARPDQPLAGEELLEGDRRLDSGNVTPRHDDAVPERDDGLERRPGPAISQEDEGLTVERLAVPEAEHGLLGWLVQEDAHEQHIVGGGPRLADNRHRLADLVVRQRIKRVEWQRHLSDRGGVHRETSVRRWVSADASMSVAADRGLQCASGE
jgi:hypothetical protein